MENKSSNGWKFFPWEEPWENSSSPVDLGLTKDAEPEADATAAAPAAEPEAA